MIIIQSTHNEKNQIGCMYDYKHNISARNACLVVVGSTPLTRHEAIRTSKANIISQFAFFLCCDGVVRIHE